MGCCGDRERQKPVNEDQKWQYLNLSDFKSTSCFSPFSYTWMVILAIVGVAVFVVDTFIAVNLLAFNKWSSQVQPAIPFEVSKWIFAVCIIISWVLCAFEWLRAYRVMRGGAVADSYLDPLALIFQSLRPGKGQGWRRFLVFAELTKSRKGVDYIALFVYFQFKGALAIIVAEGPRKVINAITLWEVLKTSLLPTGSHAPKKGASSFSQFFTNMQIFAGSNKTQAIILSAMLFTLVIWVLTVLSLMIATLFYLLFLWHYVPSSDGSLAAYCRRKVDSRLERIVDKKVKKAIERSEAKRVKEEAKAAKAEHRAPQLRKQPTLPVLMPDDDDTKTEVSFNGSGYAPSTMNGSTRGEPTLPSIDERPGPPTRTATQSSGWSGKSYGSNAPLLSQASPMGYGDPNRPPMPHMQRSMTGGSGGPMGPMNRSMTPGSRMMTPGPRSATVPPTEHDRFQLPPRSATGFTDRGRASPAPSQMSGYSNGRQTSGPHQRQNSNFSQRDRYTPSPPYGESDPHATTYDQRTRHGTPGPSYEMSPVERQPVSHNSGYGQILDLYEDAAARAHTPLSRNQNATPASLASSSSYSQNTVDPPASLQIGGPRRDMSSPLSNRGPGSVPPQRMMRSATADPMNQGYGSGPVPRAATTTPSGMRRPGMGPTNQTWQGGQPNHQW